MPNHFTDLYKTFSNQKLVEVIARPGDYQTEAVIAAQSELDTRNVSADEIDRLKTEILNTPPTVSKAEKLTNNAANYTAKKIHDFVFVPGGQTAESLLNRLIIILLIIGGFRLYNGWWMIRLMIEVPETRGLDFSIFLYFLDYFILPMCAFLIWARHRWAWYIICVYSMFSIGTAIASLYFVLTWHPSKMGGFGSLFKHPPLATIIVGLLFWSAALYLFLRKDVKEIFKITRTQVQYTIGITAGVMVLYFFV